MIESLSPSEDARFLTVTWEGGATTTLSAQTLRREARDAATVRQRIESGAVTVSEQLTITGLAQVGPSGVNVAFSDGHDRAIYPFAFLKDLSDRFDN